MRVQTVKFMMLMLLGALLSSMTVVFGAVPMRVARKAFGRWPYWLGHLAMAAAMVVSGLYPFALVYLLLTVLIGIHAEAEEHGAALFSAAIAAVLASIGVAALALGFWVQRTKVSLFGRIQEEVASWAEKATQLNPGSQFNVESLVSQLPSGFLILLIMGLAAALIWSRWLAGWMRIPLRHRLETELRAFRVPDVFVWLLIASLVGSFVRHGSPVWEAVSVNVLNVLIVVYFFQGAAVVAQFFQVFKVGAFWRGFWYFMMVVQLFLLVSLLGLADFWLDFRDRLAKRSAQMNKGF